MNTEKTLHKIILHATLNEIHVACFLFRRHHFNRFYAHFLSAFFYVPFLNLLDFINVFIRYAVSCLATVVNGGKLNSKWSRF